MNGRFEKGKRSGFPEAVEDYNRGLQLNSLQERMQLSEDGELAKRLRMDGRRLNKMRERRLQISGSMLMQMREATGITIAVLRCFLGDRHSMSRMAYKPEQRR